MFIYQTLLTFTVLVLIVLVLMLYGIKGELDIERDYTRDLQKMLKDSHDQVRELERKLKDRK